MTTLIRSFKDVCTSTHRSHFWYSLVAAISWFAAIIMALFSDVLAVDHLNYWITGMLIVSVIFSVNAMPYSPTRQRLNTVQQPAQSGHQS